MVRFLTIIPLYWRTVEGLGRSLDGGHLRTNPDKTARNQEFPGVHHKDKRREVLL
jgi:hypothetical protein